MTYGMRSLIEQDLATMILEAGGLASLDELSDRLGRTVEGIGLCVDLLSADEELKHPSGRTRLRSSLMASQRLGV